MTKSEFSRLRQSDRLWIIGVVFGFACALDRGILPASLDQGRPS